MALIFMDKPSGRDLLISKELFATPFRFVWVAESQTAILGDLHLGAQKTLAEQGIYLPEMYAGSLMRSWGKVLERRPARVIVAGDLFDRPMPGEGAIGEMNELFAKLPDGCELTVVPGNHDPQELGSLLLRKCEVVEAVKVGSYWVFHGHRLPAIVEEAGMGGVTGWICGHQHPAVTISTRVQSAKMACYAVCEVKVRGIQGRGFKLVLLPAFSRAPLGSNLLTGRHWLMPVARPGDEAIRIAGLIEPAEGEARVLDFGPLSLLSTT